VTDRPTCTASYNYGDGPMIQCRRPAGHSGDHDPMTHGYGPFSTFARLSKNDPTEAEPAPGTNGSRNV
jgi:hypothetical protein